MTYGNLPTDLGLIDLTPTEMIFWMYLPIKDAHSYRICLTENLKQYHSLIDIARHDCKYYEPWTHEFENRWYESYVYLTVKTLCIAGNYIGNRPGWHSDGFGTDDLNYIWYDRAPTEFYSELDIPMPSDCDESLATMEQYGRIAEMEG